MAGTRGFDDPNVQVNPNGLTVWYQSVRPIVLLSPQSAGQKIYSQFMGLKASRLEHVK